MSVASIPVGLDADMKIALSVLFILVAAAAFGQVSAAISAQTQMLQLPDHPQHADQHALATEQSLMGCGSVTTAHGERPLWEFGSGASTPQSLGDVARALRKEKMTARKADKVFEKQGS
jgi:hypothetical protein